MGPGTKYYNDWIMNANNTIFLKYQKIDDTKYFLERDKRGYQNAKYEEEKNMISIKRSSSFGTFLIFIQ